MLLGKEESFMRDEVKLAEEIANTVNSMTFNDVVFANAMCEQHRTLQQNAFRAFCSWVKVLADSKFYDERNERAVMLARKLKTVLEEEDA